MPKTRSGVLTGQEFVGKEYVLKCLQDSQEVEAAVVIVVVEEVAEVTVDLSVVVVVDNVEVALEAEVENAVVPDGLPPTDQCQGAEVDQLPHLEDDDLVQPLARINTR